MKKETLLEIILGTIGGLVFAIGMCMCLLPEWDLFTPGVVVGIIGFIILLCIIIFSIFFCYFFAVSFHMRSNYFSFSN